MRSCSLEVFPTCAVGSVYALLVSTATLRTIFNGSVLSEQ